MKRNMLLMTLVLVFGLVSCNKDYIFEREMYKKVFAIVSNEDYNVFTVEHDLSFPESDGYVSASMGGTNPAEKDLNITLVPSIELLNKYNTANFVETEKFARLLQPAYYSIDDYNIRIPAGERLGKTKIRVRPEGLSPDSTYLIALKVDNYSNYEINPAKSDILYRVSLKNKWAVQKTATNYMLKGTLMTNGAPGNVFGTKRVFPLTGNSVRIIAGNESFSADTAVINSRCLIVEVDPATNEVHIKPYGYLNVWQVDGDPNYPNIYFIENDGFRTFKTFLLRYNYKKKNDNALYEMREELRLEFKETK